MTKFSIYFFSKIWNLWLNNVSRIFVITGLLVSFVTWFIIGSGNGLLPVRCQAITWTTDVLRPLYPSSRTHWDKLKSNLNNFDNVSIQENIFENVVCKMTAILFRLQPVK